MFGCFKRKKKELQEGTRDWSFLGTDMHSHFIPDIDDGPELMEDSLALLKRVEALGYKKVVTTPHISFDYFPDTELKIEAGLARLKRAAAESGIGLEIEAAAEYMVDESLLKKLQQKQKLYTINNKYLLIEMGFIQMSPMLQQAIFEIQAAGYIPVLAHPERYNYFQDTAISDLRKIKETGCLFQLNTIALSGYYGKHVKILSEKLLKESLYDFAGSDIHHQRHVKSLTDLLQSNLYPGLKKYPFLNNTI